MRPTKSLLECRDVGVQCDLLEHDQPLIAGPSGKDQQEARAEILKPPCTDDAFQKYERVMSMALLQNIDLGCLFGPNPTHKSVSIGSNKQDEASDSKHYELPYAGYAKVLQSTHIFITKTSEEEIQVLVGDTRNKVSVGGYLLSNGARTLTNGQILDLCAPVEQPRGIKAIQDFFIYEFVTPEQLRIEASIKAAKESLDKRVMDAAKKRKHDDSTAQEPVPTAPAPFSPAPTSPPPASPTPTSDTVMPDDHNVSKVDDTKVPTVTGVEDTGVTGESSRKYTVNATEGESSGQNENGEGNSKKRKGKKGKEIPPADKPPQLSF